MSPQNTSGNPTHGGVLYDDSYALIRIIKHSLKYNLSIAKLLILLDTTRYPFFIKSLLIGSAKFLYIINSIGTFFSLFLLGNFYNKYDVMYNLFEEGQPIYREIKRIWKFLFNVVGMIFGGGEVEQEEEDAIEMEEEEVDEEKRQIRAVRKVFRVIGWMTKTFLFMLVLPIYIVFEKILSVRRTAMVLLIVFVLMMYTAGGGLAHSDFFSVYSTTLVFVMFLFNHTGVSIVGIIVLASLSLFYPPAYFYAAWVVDFVFSIVLISSVMASNIINTLIPKLFETKLTIQQAFSLDDKSEAEQDEEVMHVTEVNLGFDEDEIKMLDSGFQTTEEASQSKRSLWRSVLIRMKDHKLSIREIMEIYQQIEVLRADILDWFRMKYNLCEIRGKHAGTIKDRYQEISQKYDIRIDKQSHIKGMTDRIFKSLILACFIAICVYVVAVSNVVFGRGTIAYFSRGIIDLSVSQYHWMDHPYLYFGIPGYAIYTVVYVVLAFVVLQVFGGSLRRMFMALAAVAILSLIPITVIFFSGQNIGGILPSIQQYLNTLGDFGDYFHSTLIKSLIFGISYGVYYVTYALHFALAYVLGFLRLLSMNQWLTALITWTSISLIIALTIGPIVGVKSIKLSKRS